MIYNMINKGKVETWEDNYEKTDKLKNYVLQNINVSELARRIGRTSQNSDKKLKRDAVTLDELKQIANVMKSAFE